MSLVSNITGVVAAGGSGTRLAPLSNFVNKHLAPCEPGKLMIDYPMTFMRQAGFDELTVVTGSNHAHQIAAHVGDGERYGFTRIDYAFQAQPAGIADVLKRIAHKNKPVLLILGDNYFDAPISLTGLLESNMAFAWEYNIGDAHKAKAFGQAIRNEEGEVVFIQEKPSNPKHGRILTGLYYFPADVFSNVEKLSPSARNELEVTHLLDMYLKEHRLGVRRVAGSWADLGEWFSLQQFWVEKGLPAYVRRDEFGAEYPQVGYIH